MRLDNLAIDAYELEAWITRLGSIPVQQVAHKDLSESYEMIRGHVFKLENGQYALVTEEGCSCYEASSAAICLYPDRRSAMHSFESWVKYQQHEDL